jgi:hypothetical protein
MDIAAIVLASLSLVASTISPVIIAGAHFIEKIKKSSCCGNSSVELADPTNKSPVVGK